MRKVNAIGSGLAGGLAVLAWAYILRTASRSWSVQPAYLAFTITITAVACLAWTLTCVVHGRHDGETRCRRCGYILRGLSEPRCPECGERI